MKLPELGPGVVLGVGKTNFRVGELDAAGNIPHEPLIIKTPSKPKVFFARAGREILEAAHGGARWAVLGAPGPVDVSVDRDDNVTQRLKVTNIPALNRKNGFDPVAEMIAADSAFEDLLRSGFHFLTVNDGNLAAQAGAKLFATDKHNTVADIIVGSGNGGFVIERDTDFEGQNLFHPVTGDWETGHFPRSLYAPASTPEERISGKAFHGRFDKKIRDLSPGHWVFPDIGRDLAYIAVNLGLTASPDLIVISGGIGVEAQDKYKIFLEGYLKSFANSDNPMGRLATRADIRFPDVEMADTYELYGGPGVIHSHLTKRAISQLLQQKGNLGRLLRKPSANLSQKQAPPARDPALVA